MPYTRAMLFPTTLVGSYPQPEQIAARIRSALRYVKPEDVILAPDCGMKYLPREVADGKLRAMVEAARVLRGEYAGARG